MSKNSEIEEKIKTIQATLPSNPDDLQTLIDLAQVKKIELETKDLKESEDKDARLPHDYVTPTEVDTPKDLHLVAAKIAEDRLSNLYYERWIAPEQQKFTSKLTNLEDDSLKMKKYNKLKVTKERIQEVKDFLLENKMPVRFEKTGIFRERVESAFKKQWQDFTVEEGQLKLGNRIVVAQEDAYDMVDKLYQCPEYRAGRDRFYHRIKELYIGIPKDLIMMYLKRQPT